MRLTLSVALVIDYVSESFVSTRDHFHDGSVAKQENIVNPKCFNQLHVFAAEIKGLDRRRNGGERKTRTVEPEGEAAS